jgi:hypothetical protein
VNYNQARSSLETPRLQLIRLQEAKDSKNVPASPLSPSIVDTIFEIQHHFFAFPFPATPPANLPK